jgi:chemotaxis protein methyltransferase CheR
MMEASQYTMVQMQVWRLLHIDLSSYKSEQMRRRLDSWLVRANAPDWDVYFHRLRSDEQELGKFRNYLTINVSEFFRDAGRWLTLEKNVIPALLKAARLQRPGQSGLRVWSAGCSTGQEPYSLAILLDEQAAWRPRILATDLDRGALKKAGERGPYSPEDVANVSPERRTRYFEPGGPPFYVKEKTARSVTFGELNLLLDPFEKDFDLIVCRNVIIYFTTEAKTELYRRFADALRPGGTLFLGGTEVLSHPAEFGLRNQGISLYTRI